MSIEIQTDSAFVRVKLTGKLVKEDYETLVPAVNALVADRGPVRMLVQLHDFHGWSMAAVWEDTKFAAHHVHDIARLAMVGEKSWQHGMAAFCKPFTKAKVRYFDASELAEAEAWVGAD